MNGIFESIPFAIAILIAGFVFLVKGADVFVEGSSSIAKTFKIPSIIIGMTIVAMGTSLPETAVSVVAAVSGNNELAVSNAVGSNIFNLMVVIGVCAFITPIAVKKETLTKDFPISVACAVLLLVLGLVGMSLGRIDGIIFILLFIGFLIYMVRSAKKSKPSLDTVGETDEIKIMSIPKSIVFIVLGGVAIALGSDWVVKGASTIATHLGISQTLIGLTVVAFGTSLPELVTSIVAAKKNEVDMALGNAIGSNIFNILMVLGIAGAISPINFLTENIIDIVILVALSAIVWFMAFTKRKLSKLEGAIMCLLYGAYVVYICLR